jgi:hypothetical protein
LNLERVKSPAKRHHVMVLLWHSDVVR